MGGMFARPRAEIAAGAVHVPGWLSIAEQQRLVTACREWARPPAGMRHTAMPSGGQMSVQTVCLGWHWMPYRYSRTAEDVDGAPVKPFPDWLADLGRRALKETLGEADQPAAYTPDVALINYYDGSARMGMHADKDERSAAPVVSLSLGSSCVFRFGNAENRGKPYAGRDARVRRPVRVRRTCAVRLPRRHEDDRRDRATRHRPARGPAQHHAAGIGPDLTAGVRLGPRRSASGPAASPQAARCGRREWDPWEMPEGDVVWRVSRQLDAALAGRALTRSDFRVPRFATTNLSGPVGAGGSLPWQAHPDQGRGRGHHPHAPADGRLLADLAGGRYPPRDHRVRLVLENAQWQAVGYLLGVVEVLPTAREERALGHLGPDLLGPDWDAAEAVRRLGSQPDRPIGEALLDQRNLAGIGNLYKSEVLFLRGISPWLPAGQAGDLEPAVDTGAAPARGEQGAHRAGHDRQHRTRRGDLGVRQGGPPVPALRNSACWPTATRGGAGRPRSGSRSGAPRASRAPADHEQRRSPHAATAAREPAPRTQASAFVLANSTLRPVPLAPEIRLHLADDAFGLWEATEAGDGRAERPPPFWAFAWPGGQALARYVLDHPDVVAGRAVLDLGAGSGIAGIAAAMAGAATVLASDLDPFADGRDSAERSHEPRRWSTSPATCSTALARART